MYHWNEMYWETYLSDQTNTQTVISLETIMNFWTNLYRSNMKEWSKSQTSQTANDRH